MRKSISLNSGELEITIKLSKKEFAALKEMVLFANSMSMKAVKCETSALIHQSFFNISISDNSIITTGPLNKEK